MTDNKRKMLLRLVKEVKSKISIKDIVDYYGIQKGKMGNQYHCCFHGKDEHPSASIDKGIFYCFTCHEALDPVGFVQKYENCGMWKALKIIDTHFSLGLFRKLTQAEFEEQKRKEEERAIIEKKKELEEQFKTKCLNQIAEQLRIWEQGKQDFHITRGEYRKGEWENAKMFFECIRNIERLEYLYFTLIGKDVPECIYTYEYGNEKEILEGIKTGEIVI